MNKEQLRDLYKSLFQEKADSKYGKKALIALIRTKLVDEDDEEEEDEEDEEDEDEDEEEDDDEDEDAEDKKMIVSKKQLQKTIGKAVKTANKGLKKELKSVKEKLVERPIEKGSLSQTGEVSQEVKEKVGQFFRALVTHDEAKAKGLSEGTDADGGYLVHPEFVREVIRVAEEYGVARRYCRVFPMKSNDKNVSTLAGTVTAYWVGEGAQITASAPTFGRRTLTAQKLAAICFGTNELIDDAEDAEIFDLVAELIAEEFVEKEDEAVLTGTGSSFTGILEHASAIVTTMSSGDTSFADITADYLLTVMRSVAIKYKKKKPRWFMSQDIIEHIEKLKDSNGQYIYRGPTNGEVGTLWGYPIELTDVMPQTADDAVSTKFVAFGDLRFWGMGDRKQVATKILSEGTVATVNLGEKDQQALRAIERVAFVGLIPEAFAVLKTAAS